MKAQLARLAADLRELGKILDAPPLPRRDPGATFRKPAAFTLRPKPPQRPRQ